MKEQFSCQETKSLWGRRLLQSVPITLSLFVAIGSTAELMAANVVESVFYSRLHSLAEVWSM